jgi:hypothetical protein
MGKAAGEEIGKLVDGLKRTFFVCWLVGWYWGLNSESCTCWAGLLELHAHLFFLFHLVLE